MKRKRPSRGQQCSNKRQKSGELADQRPSFPLLRKYYPEVVKLRQYLASRLSKKRRKRLLQYDSTNGDASVVELLDTTLIGAFKHVHVDESSFAEDELTIFTQQLTHSESSISLTPGDFKQTEIVDFVIWLLFRRSFGTQRPKHILCQNFQRYMTEIYNGPDPEIVPGIPGVYSVGPNEHAQALRCHPWTAIPGLIGKGAEKIVGDILMDCGIFTPMKNTSNLIQLSGIPMCDLPVLSIPAVSVPMEAHARRNGDTATKRGLTDIRFVRYRMLYSRPALNARGSVRFGLNQIHVLNRCRDLESVEETNHVMKYLFPAQFGLHNVLQSTVDVKDTSDPFKDYTLREQEIARQGKTRAHTRHSSSLPKRLRGTTQKLVESLRKRHHKCSYSELLQHYCPRPGPNGLSTDASIQLASNESQVSAFCRAAVSHVFPTQLWGKGETGAHNSRRLHQSIDRFVRLRRFENMSLHDALQGLRLNNVEWLTPPKLDKGRGLSKTDFAKRKELMAELLYYLFDSFVIPLIRGHFHVTESNVHRNQLFYFRHDIWKEMAEPALSSLKQSMLEECKPAAVKEMLAKRSLGVSYVRMLPKEHGM